MNPPQALFGINFSETQGRTLESIGPNSVELIPLGHIGVGIDTSLVVIAQGIATHKNYSRDATPQPRYRVQ